MCVCVAALFVATEGHFALIAGSTFVCLSGYDFMCAFKISVSVDSFFYFVQFCLRLFLTLLAFWFSRFLPLPIASHDAWQRPLSAFVLPLLYIYSTYIHFIYIYILYILFYFSARLWLMLNCPFHVSF